MGKVLEVHSTENACILERVGWPDLLDGTSAAGLVDSQGKAVMRERKDGEAVLDRHAPGMSVDAVCIYHRAHPVLRRSTWDSDPARAAISVSAAIYIDRI